MKGLKSATIDSFIIEISILSPIKDIIGKLKNQDFRDCDIQWLDGKLDAFTRLACEAIGVNSPTRLEREKAIILNDYNVNQYVSRFGILLEYFKSVPA